MKTRHQVFKNTEQLIFTEMSTIAQHRLTGSQDLHWIIVNTRKAQLLQLHEAVELQDIGLLLDIERYYMESELENVSLDPDNIRSLRKGIAQANAAAIMLDRVRDPAEYRQVAFYYSLSEDLVDRTDLPKDAAYKFFGSQRARLLNNKSDMNPSERSALFQFRRHYLLQARKDYMELQRQALATGGTQGQKPPLSEIREPSPAYPCVCKPPLGIRVPRKHYRLRQQSKLAA